MIESRHGWKNEAIEELPIGVSEYLAHGTTPAYPDNVSVPRRILEDGSLQLIRQVRASVKRVVTHLLLGKRRSIDVALGLSDIPLRSVARARV